MACSSSWKCPLPVSWYAPQQFLFPQLDEDDQEGRSSLAAKKAHPLITSTPTSQVERFPRSYTPGFFLWGFIKDGVFVPPLSANVVELRSWIIATVAVVTSEMLRSVWQETDYRQDVCGITSGSRIEP
jgi:hypothetical protein